MKQFEKQLIILLPIIIGLYVTVSANITGIVVDMDDKPVEGAAVVAL